MSVLNFLKRKLVEAKKDKGEDIYIKTGSGSFDGVHSFTGWPLEKTNIARKPSKAKGEISCLGCDGSGWDASPGGSVFICPECEGTGVINGNAVCVCGHKRYEHYSDGTCEHDYLDLYAESGHRMIHSGEYDINKRPCKCTHFAALENSE